ncbi:myb/SANT-like DNA-binding domain-containing protein 3 [Melitaea cinxia]|uniref:myb/SANT-like DNA-binding domain-containing protein 3 n=1 Tax=Melitaea cinxia TaxID=113334 RepID=UPI001E2719C7|nr:myb/SANT-like DNA-binding domain-containing protein 3 [Melitaea cinxia]
MSDIERKKPFSSLEKDLFLNIIQKYDEILSCKKTNAVSALKKKNCWENIRNEFNSSPIVTQKAATKQLLKLWYNMKAKAREAKTKENVRFMTGGGPLVDDMNPIDAKVMDIDKNILTNVQVDVDSDINGSLVKLGDENDEAWSKNTNCYADIPDLPDKTIEMTLKESTSTPSTSTQCISEENLKKHSELFTMKTPLKKSSFGEKYINKIDLLKIKLLEEQLQHQQEMHKEDLKIKIMEREHKEKIWAIELKIKERQLLE